MKSTTKYWGLAMGEVACLSSAGMSFALSAPSGNCECVETTTSTEHATGFCRTRSAGDEWKRRWSVKIAPVRSSKNEENAAAISSANFPQCPETIQAYEKQEDKINMERNEGKLIKTCFLRKLKEENEEDTEYEKRTHFDEVGFARSWVLTQFFYSCF